MNTSNQSRARSASCEDLDVRMLFSATKVRYEAHFNERHQALLGPKDVSYMVPHAFELHDGIISCHSERT